MTTSYVPEDGDEVEVVLRGKVRDSNGVWFWIGHRGSGNCIDLDAEHVSVTRVTPALPTTLDSKVDATSNGGGGRGEWVLVETCHDGGRWVKVGSPLGAFGVNLTVHSVLRVGGAA